MQDATIGALVEYLREFDPVVEVAVGNRPAVAGALADAGVSVLATDLRERAVPTGVPFRRDDLTDPDRSLYAEAEAIYAINLPAELQRPARDLARGVGARFFFSTLGAEQPVIPATPATLPAETLYRAESQRA